MSNTTLPPALAGQVEPTVRPSTLAAFLEALNGRRGDLDAWLECNNEAEVRAHVMAWRNAAVATERERCAQLAATAYAESTDVVPIAQFIGYRIRGA